MAKFRLEVPAFYFKNFEQRDIAIHISNFALMHLMMSTIESFHVRPWGKDTSETRGPVETAGLLWGHFFQKEDHDHVYVDQVSTDTYADRQAGSVALNEKVTMEKQKLVTERWPFLALVGDFHTHPYGKKTMTSTEVKNQGYWRFSDGDYECSENNDYFNPLNWDGRISLVMTIAQVQRLHEVEPEHLTDNAHTWLFDKYRFFLAAYALDVDDAPSHDERKRKYVTTVSPPRQGKRKPRHRPRVYIDVPMVHGTNPWYSYSNDDQ